MNKRNRLPVNNIDYCLQQAQVISERLHNPQLKDGSICRVFGSLARDTTTGLLAYAIWRGRSDLLSYLVDISK